MQAMDAVRGELLPLVDALVERLTEEGEVQGAHWFQRVRTTLEAAATEEDLILLFIEQLSPVAPMATGYSLDARLQLDALLARAQDVAFAFSADGEAH
ncbi:MAG TPA: hypothetical protein VLA56_11785 [Pseudomonadales bacterium]|nr:hypothetical protein [Pseudomonadales bacterium]